jgi:hypothetical protein
MTALATIPGDAPAALRTQPSGVAGPDRDNRSDRGMATAEYAVGTLAACGFGTVLYKLLTSDSVAGLLGDLIKKALELVLG